MDAFQDLQKQRNDLFLENKKLQDKLERYEKALKFYANKDNYECDDETLNPAICYIHIVVMDYGEEARKALGIEED